MLKMQHYIAVTPHALRCPCSQGLELDSIGFHFPGCNLVPALEMKEKLIAEVYAEKMQRDLRRQRMERNWHDTKRRAQDLEGTCDSALLTHCPRDFLDLLKAAVKAEKRKG